PDRSPPPAPPSGPGAGSRARSRTRGSPAPGAPSSAPPPAPRANAAPWGPRAPCRRLSGQPALAPAVVLRVAEVLPSRPAEAQVELLHVGVAGQGRRVAVHHHPAGLQDVAVVRVAERRRGVLLREQEAHLL